MRMSCNGCRVLRKGCSEDCTLRPSIQWIDSTDAQSNATLFLAKYYGRAGLLNLINAGPPHQRGEVFQSLLYEACGRIINPVYGSAGLMSSGEWHRCQAAVEAVLAGAPLDGDHHSDSSSHRPRVRKSRKSRATPASDELSPEAEGVFTITGWEGDHHSQESWSENRSEPGNGAGGIGLELTLGSDPVMETYLYEREQNWR